MQEIDYNYVMLQDILYRKGYWFQNMTEHIKTQNLVRFYFDLNDNFHYQIWHMGKIRNENPSPKEIAYMKMIEKFSYKLSVILHKSVPEAFEYAVNEMENGDTTMDNIWGARFPEGDETNV